MLAKLFFSILLILLVFIFCSLIEVLFLLKFMFVVVLSLATIAILMVQRWGVKKTNWELRFIS